MKRGGIAAPIGAVVVGLLTLTGCGGGVDNTAIRPGLAEKICKENAANRMKDPDSAKFRNVTVQEVNKDEFWRVDGEVSGVNSFGGRNGFLQWKCTAKYNPSEESVETDAFQVESE